MTYKNTEPCLCRHTFLGRRAIDVGLIGGQSGCWLVTVISDMFDGIVLGNIRFVGHPLPELKRRHCDGLL